MTAPGDGPGPAPPAAPPGGWGPGTMARAGRHPAVRVVALATGGLLTLVLLAATSFGAANLLVRTTESDVRTLEGPVTRAVVDVDGRIDVVVGPDDRARVERSSTFGLRRPSVRRTLVDGLLTVQVTCGDLPGLCSSDVTLTLPATAEVAVTGEHVTVTGTTGPVEADADGGAVELTDLSGPIDVRTGGGAVVGRDLRSDVVRASVGAGAVDLEMTRPPSDVEASTGAGSVVVVLPPDGTAYRVDATAGAGSQDVRVATDPASPRRVRASTGAGSVEVRYGRG